MQSWYWIADPCDQEGIVFVLGHAYYMKAIHGGKAKSDKIDSEKFAMLLRGGNLPYGYAYPARVRAARDLLRRRIKWARLRADTLAHIQNTVSQYNLPPLGMRIGRCKERALIPAHFPDPVVRHMIELDLIHIKLLDRQLAHLKRATMIIRPAARGHDWPVVSLCT